MNREKLFNDWWKIEKWYILGKKIGLKLDYDKMRLTQEKIMSHWQSLGK